MTATRWWVRLAARWIARIDGVAAQVRLAMLSLTGVSTATFTLKQYGHGGLALPFIAVVGGGLAVYTYLYTEGGVWNQVERDRQDMSSNFSDPTMRIDDEIVSRGIRAAQKGEPLSDAERAAVRTELDAAFMEYRDGVTIDREVEV